MCKRKKCNRLGASVIVVVVVVVVVAAVVVVVIHCKCNRKGRITRWNAARLFLVIVYRI